MQNRSFLLAFSLLLMLSSCSMQHNINKMSGVYNAKWTFRDELNDNIAEILILNNNKTFTMLYPNCQFIKYCGYWEYTDLKQIKLECSPIPPAITLTDILEGRFTNYPNYTLDIIDKYTLLKEDSAMYFNRFDKLQVPKNTNYKNNTDHTTTQRQHKKSLRMAGVYEYKTSDPDTPNQDPMYLILRPTGELITMQRHRAKRWGEWLYTSPRTIQFTMRFERDTSLILNNRTVHVVNKNVLQLNQPDSIVFTRVKTRLF